jgi:linoleoyl-CoA desaturase
MRTEPGQRFPPSIGRVSASHDVRLDAGLPSLQTIQRSLEKLEAARAAGVLLLSVVLVPVHMVDEAPFDIVTEEGTIEEGWFIHVFKNTIDYSRNSRLANLLFGGLNTHLVHHLFPSVCHAHYIALSDILEEAAREYDIPYRAVTMPRAVASHFRLLARMGR